MRMTSITAIAAIAAICCAGASAAPQVKATLPCTFGQSMEQDHMLDILNTTKAALPAETIVNLDITTRPNGEQFDCFALTAPLGAGAHLSHMEKVTVGTDGLMCKAFLSKKYPAISHGSDGSSSTQCDY
jgi:ABC-type glycerol-3-phosphate transport system substrate-binding protein